MKLEILQKAVDVALKAGDTLKVETLRRVVAAVKKAAIDKRCEITEELVDEALLKEQKIVQEMIDTCPETRTDLLAKYNHKLNIVNAFAPKLVTDETTIKTMIGVALASAGIDPETANRGQVMKAVMPALKGKVDMKIANQVIATFLK